MFVCVYFVESTRLEKQVESLDKERQELLNENIKINEDSHKLVS